MRAQLTLPTFYTPPQLLAIRESLFKKHRCTLGPTKWVPPLLNIPLFLALSFAIRQSLLTPDSPLLREILPWWSAPEHLSQSFETSAAMLRDRGLDPEALQKLSRPMGPTLGDKDGTNVAPLAVGLLTFLNLELATKGRETVQRIMRRGKAQQDQLDQQSVAVAQGANYGEKRAGMRLEKIKSDEEIEVEQRKKGGVQKWASIGRGLSIASVTLATQVPGVSTRTRTRTRTQRGTNSQEAEKRKSDTTPLPLLLKTTPLAPPCVNRRLS